MAGEKLLVIDDDAPQRETLVSYLSSRGFEVLGAENGEVGLGILSQERIDLILTDFRMPKMDGAGVLKAARELNPEIEVVLMTAFGSIDGAVSAMNAGAFHYLEKPVDLDDLDRIVDEALEKHHRVSENKVLVEQSVAVDGMDGIVLADPSMEKALNVAARGAQSRASILILGESGTGKELVANAIHRASSRKDKPFVVVNCAALNENLLESELFGHEKGAFTGADRTRTGRFEEADGGTLFIDEVGEIPLVAQAKLLRVLQERAFERVGGNQTLKVDVRLISATNRDLAQMVADGSFREDLLYRLKVVTVELPPLRNRKRDIPVLAEGFLVRYARENEKKVQGISTEAMDTLMRYDYPGNVRELQNIIENAVVMARGEVITVRDLPLGGVAKEQTERGDDSLPSRVEQLERSAIRQALEDAEGVQSKAANLLGITERNLRYKLKKYGFKP